MTGGWQVWQPGDDEDEAMFVEIVDDETGVPARREFAAEDAVEFWRAVRGAVGNIQP